jgi:hypothetical protein
MPATRCSLTAWSTLTSGLTQLEGYSRALRVVPARNQTGRIESVRDARQALA